MSWSRALSGLSVLPLAVSLAWASAGTALVAECEPSDGLSTCVDSDQLWVRPGNGLFLTGGGSTTTPEGSVSFGLTTSYARRPLVLLAQGADLDPREVFVIDNLVTSTFTFALGVTDRLELLAALPVTFFHDGAGYFALRGSDAALTRSVMRDPRFGFQYAFLARDRVADASGFGLSARFELGMPFGDEAQFAGVRGGTFVPAVAASYRMAPFEAKLEAEARIRREESIANVVYGTQIGVTAGVSVEVYEPLGVSFAAEAFALPVVASQGDGAEALVPAEWLASARIAPLFAGDLYIQAGAGSALPFTSSNATAPQLRAALTLAYAPRGLDSDRDRVLDRDDGCLLEAEDRDGFQDQDGCPDPDNDGDGVADLADRCRDDAETSDGFEDEDGCPDLDDDEDGIPDVDDACRNDREDEDGFEDDDGCPDLDNDADGVLDGADACPRDAEDRDGFQDEDGCPELDNDADGVPDGADKCPRDREDRDGFQDDDGCPDPDNDADGLPDGSDRCPLEAETLDGTADEDGCPEPGAKSVLRVRSDGVVELLPVVDFPKGRADVTPALTRIAKVVATLARAEGRRVVIEGHGDGPGPAGERLGLSRAQSFKRALVREGLGEDLVTAVSGDAVGARVKGAHLDLTLAPRDEAE
jgi:outer membrane protein OmpA-like peptidoglycan-associated protein